VRAPPSLRVAADGPGAEHEPGQRDDSRASRRYVSFEMFFTIACASVSSPDSCSKSSTLGPPLPPSISHRRYHGGGPCLSCSTSAC
jgi:hypothetical protein